MFHGWKSVVAADVASGAVETSIPLSFSHKQLEYKQLGVEEQDCRLRHLNDSKTVKVFVNRHKCKLCDEVFKTGNDLKNHTCSKVAKALATAAIATNKAAFPPLDVNLSSGNVNPVIEVTLADLDNTAASILQPVFAVKSKPPPVHDVSLLDTSDEGPLDSHIKPKKRCSKKSEGSAKHQPDISYLSCPFCDAKLKNKKSLWKHKLRLHSKNNGPDVIICKFCDSPVQKNNKSKHQKSRKCRKFQ